MCSNKSKLLPKPNKKSHDMIKHGEKRNDEYFWLRDKDSVEVKQHLLTENNYTAKHLNDTVLLQENLFAEMTARLVPKEQSVPYFKKGYFYYQRYEENLEYPIYCRRKHNLEAKEEIILDVNSIVADNPYCNIGSLSIDTSQQLLAYTVDFTGDRIYKLIIKNLKTGVIVKVIDEVCDSIVWATGVATVFYIKFDKTLRPYQVWRHTLHSAETEDILVFEEQDTTFSCDVTKTKSAEYLLISCHQTVSSEYWYCDASNPTEEFRLFIPRSRFHEYYLEHANNKFYIHTNWQAKNFRILMTDKLIDKIDEGCQELVAHDENSLIADMEVFSNYIALEVYENSLSKIKIVELNSQNSYTVQFDEGCYASCLGVNPEIDTNIVRLHYTSMTTPDRVIAYNMSKHTMDILKEQQIRGDFKRNLYKTERLFINSIDGVKIPLSLVYKIDKKQPNGNPLLLYAYGAYGHSIEPGFSLGRLTLLDRGFIFAIAHVRGGQECGRSWYEQGKLLNKKNSFQDFIDCAKFLITEKYAAANKLYAMGGSAGGLLMGAVMNMAPQLFHGVIAQVPFVDTLTTMLDKDLPLTTGEYDEWGNPDDINYYKYIKSYSPYDNIKPDFYPNLLVTTSLHDSQVSYWEPAKWVAKLRDNNKNINSIILLKIDMDVGHSGLSGRFQKYRDIALEYAFLLKLSKQ